MEARVVKLQCSVGREGWRKPNVEMPLLISGYRAGTSGDEITSRFYLNLTHTRYPMSAREIFSQRNRQPAWVGEGQQRKGRHGWSYHEGSFYLLVTVLRFIRHLERSLTIQQILNASNSPEEWWLQAWTLNWEPASTPVQPSSQQLCLRWNVSYNASRAKSFVPSRVVQKVRDDLLCPQPLGSYRFYALKRFVRDAAHATTAGILRLGRAAQGSEATFDEHARSWRHNSSSSACVRARAARARLP